MTTKTILMAAFGAALLCAAAAPASARPARPWTNASLSPDARADLVEKRMTQDEKFTLLHGYFAMPFFSKDGSLPKGALGSAGFVPGIPRLGIPALQESDASLGVANPMNVRKGDSATALPSGLALAATFDPGLAYDGGAMIGQEAWRKGLNVLLAGGGNLARDPRNGRNFEYLGEDPLLAGTLDGESIRGIQDQHVVSTMKHFVLNDQETNRHWANGVIDPAALRESDLLAFEIANDRGHPGSVMCSYNLINGHYACANKFTLDTVLKGDWGYPGWVMSDWGAVHSANDALEGLDQESGQEIDKQIFFDKPLRALVKDGTVPQARIDNMVHRILRSMFAVGLFDHPPVQTPVDYKADAEVAQSVAEHGIVLLKNADNALPLAAGAKHVAVIGGHADAGVLSGGGSAQVIPHAPRGMYPTVAVGGEGMMGPFSSMTFDPSSPLQAMRGLDKDAEFRFDTGRYVAAAVKLAKASDVAIVFATQWEMEGSDLPDLSLPGNQDALIEAVAAANPHTIVVLETGNPVLMPWLDKVQAVVEAWYPGQSGGEAIANVLYGKVNPSGHLPITFPKSIDQNPRPDMPGIDLKPGQVFDVHYTEGAKVGYRWFADQKLTPLFPFGFGLSYASFSFSNLTVEGGQTLTVSFDVTNTGSVAGEAVPQVYLTSQAGKPLERLIGFERVSLEPGQSQHVSVSADPRLIANFDTTAKGWRVDAGEYGVAVSRSANDPVLTGSAALTGEMVQP